MPEHPWPSRSRSAKPRGELSMKPSFVWLSVRKAQGEAASESVQHWRECEAL